MTDYKTLYDAIVNLNIPIEKQGKFANDKDFGFEYAHFPYIGKSNQSDVVDVNTPLTFEAKADDTKIYFLAYKARKQTRTIEVSTDDGNTWTEFTSETYNGDNNTPIATLNIGQKVLVRGDNPNGFGYYDDDEGPASAGAFRIDGETYVYGNVMSLLNKDSFATMKSVPEYVFTRQFSSTIGNWDNDGTLFSHPKKRLLLPATTLAGSCYSYMFASCTSLTAAPELPATTLAEMCYRNIFAGCTNLTTVPKLPATTLAMECYENMFSGCTSLATAPELPATTLTYGCYFLMFSDCASLTTGPELPAMTLDRACYYGMFSGCTSLTTAPELPATTLAEECYNRMFYGCTNLIAAPELPATTLANSCYNSMFYGCSSLATAPELPATTLVQACYNAMFFNCFHISFVKCAFTTTPGNSYTSNWLKNVSATGTFVKNSAATWNVTGDNGIPTGWTVETA